ncbi:MAG: hypothetical protein SGJ09_06685 [Phycisphaerae bacterium]|nr:hypothetical protein [Phycisphaerae bacterium]
MAVASIAFGAGTGLGLAGWLYLTSGNSAGNVNLVQCPAPCVTAWRDRVTVATTGCNGLIPPIAGGLLGCAVVPGIGTLGACGHCFDACTLSISAWELPPGTVTNSFWICYNPAAAVTCGDLGGLAIHYPCLEAPDLTNCVCQKSSFAGLGPCPWAPGGVWGPYYKHC